MTAAAGVSVLIVDDDSTKRLALKAVLMPLGCRLVEADSGLAALRCVMNQDFAVILLDVLMPLMDGFETAARIRQRAQSELTPIIFITAFANDEIVSVDRFAEGAVDFMFAPVAPEELRAKVGVFANLFTKGAQLAKRAREAEASADQFRFLADVAPIGIFQTNAQNQFVYTNPRWSEITGVPAPAALGREWETIIESKRQAVLLAELADDARERAELSHRCVIQLPGAASRIVLVTSRSIPDNDGAIAGWVGTLADVTAEAGAEAAMSEARDKADEASRFKSDFLANMSHEIRTPMNGVIGMTDVLLETDLDPRQRDYAQTVRNSGEALLTIIDDILDFSKVEAGKVEIEHVECDLGSVIDDVVDLLAGPAQTKGIEFVADIDKAVPAVVTGDPGRVRQVLTNLIGNAIKFTQAGEIVVRVTPEQVAGTETMIRFEVSDTGGGIAPDKLATVFQPFVQADTSTTRKYGGTGLGLAISSQLVALMGGDCGVSSQLGAGSLFWFTIRVHANAEQATRAQTPPEATLDAVSVLLVDDNATQRAVVSRYLTGWGMTVSVADSGPAALATMRAATDQGNPFAVAVIDQTMPGMDGAELISRIASDPDLQAAIVLMTGLNQTADLGHADASERRACVSKPIHHMDLQDRLRRVLGLRPPDPQRPKETVSGTSPAGKSEAGRLLLAEDNEINQKVAVLMLSSAGYKVDTVLNGAAAVQAITVHVYDAILMDCQMPEMNGFEATAAIRAHEEGSDRRTPIIALTAGARQEDRERCLAEGMDSYLAKPVSKDALLALVGHSVKRGTCPGPNA